MRRIGRKLAQKFDDEIRFFKGWMNGPKTVGAIMPTSSVMASRMAAVITPESGLPVLELGPGTGVITKAILARGLPPERLVSVEYTTHFLDHLARSYPGVDFVQGDAFDLSATLGERRTWTFDCAISGLPLLNFPMHKRVALIEDLLDRLPPGRPVVQFSYGPVSPVAAMPDRYRIRHLDFIVRNIPPAQIWLYSRDR